MTTRAGFAPGEAREDWAILRALSAVLGKTLPFDNLGQLRAALYAAHAHLAAIDQIKAGDAGDIGKLAAHARQARQGGFCLARNRFLSHEPDCARVQRDGRMLGPRQGTHCGGAIRGRR